MPPVYEAECPKCGREADYFASIDERNKLVPKCCGRKMDRVIASACYGYVQGDVAYESPASGKVITSHAARRDDMKRTRSRPWEGMETEQQESRRKKQYAEKKEDAQIEDAARRAYHQLPPKKRAVLERE